jgi:hypothetical protein
MNCGLSASVDELRTLGLGGRLRLLKVLVEMKWGKLGLFLNWPRPQMMISLLVFENWLI